MGSLLKRLIVGILLFCYPCQMMLAMSGPTPVEPSAFSSGSMFDANSNNLPPTENPINTSSDPLTALQTIGLGNPNLNWGPLSIGGEYDTLLGMIFNAHYAQQLNENLANAYCDRCESGRGPNEWRNISDDYMHEFC